MRYSGEKVWLIGASSGIGAALAHALVQQGATVLLSARSTTTLQPLAKQLGSDHQYLSLDVSDTDQVAQSVKQAHQTLGHFDRVIFLAGVYEPTAIENINIPDLQQHFQVNIIGAIALVQAVLPYLLTQPAERKSQLCMVASVAGWFGLPNAQPYAATKAALINFTESLQAEMQGRVDVKLINPGFVATRLTAKNAFPMPFCLSPETAANRIVKQLNQNRFEIHFPRRLTWTMKLIRCLPYSLRLRLLRKLDKS